MNLIPLTESELQKRVEDVGTSSLGKFDVSLLSVNPLFCHVSLLSHLAFSLDVSISGLEENEARAYLQNAREIKKYTGSVYAVNKAASSIFGEDIKVEPWNKHNGVPGTYKFIIDARTKNVNDENINKTIKLVDTAKRVSAQLSGITVNMKNSASFNVATTITSSETVSIQPRALEDLELNIKHRNAITVYMIEKTVLSPRIGV